MKSFEHSDAENAYTTVLALLGQNDVVSPLGSCPAELHENVGFGLSCRYLLSDSK